MEQTYCLVADLLGFRTLLRTLDADKGTKRVEQWIEIATTARAKHDVRYFQLLSDMVFAAERVSGDGLERLLKFSQDLVEQGISQNFPVRGAIECGGSHWSSEVVHGPGLVRAYETASKVDWIGIVCTRVFPHLTKLWDARLVCSYPAPIRSTDTGRHFACVTWRLPLHSSLMDLATARGLSNPLMPVEPAVLRKIHNTEGFLEYCRKLDADETGLPAGIYHGM
jgi:hypothetical protein